MIDHKFYHSLKLEEIKNEKLVQSVELQVPKVNAMPVEVFRFDLDKSNFLPFFNADHDTTYKGLRSFADYIILCERKNITWIVIAELKSGSDSAHACHQLNATDTFVNYLLDTACRLANDFGEISFSKKNIQVRKVQLHRCRSNKTTTRNSWEFTYTDRYSRIDCGKTLSLLKLLR